MQSAQEFMDLYLREKAGRLKEIRQINHDSDAKFFAKDLLGRISAWHGVRNENTESLSVAEATHDKAKVITTELVPSGPWRRSYHLRKSRGNWEIFKMERECAFCKGSGRSVRKPCDHCGGTGWKDCYPH